MGGWGFPGVAYVHLYGHGVVGILVLYGQKGGTGSRSRALVRTSCTDRCYRTYMYQNLRLELRLSDRDRIVLDQKRGNVSRSKYLRWLIHHGPEPVVDGSLSEQGGHPHPDPIVPPIDEPPVPQPIVPPAPPDPPVETKRDYSDDPAMTGTKTHYHRFKKAGEPVSFHQGRPQYRMRCACGDTKVGP